MKIDAVLFARVNEYIELRFGNQNTVVIVSDDLRDNFGITVDDLDDFIAAARKFKAKYNIKVHKRLGDLYCDIRFTRFPDVH